MSEILDTVAKQRYRRIADVLVPRTQNMPSATEADPDLYWLGRALDARPDLAVVICKMLNEQGADEPESFLAMLRATHPEAFESLNFLVVATYYMIPNVRRLLGRFAELRRPLERSKTYDFVEDGLLDLVAARGSIWRRPP